MQYKFCRLRYDNVLAITLNRPSVIKMLQNATSCRFLVIFVGVFWMTPPLHSHMHTLVYIVPVCVMIRHTEATHNSGLLVTFKLAH